MAIAIGGDAAPILGGADLSAVALSSSKGAKAEQTTRSFTDAEKTACSIDAMRNGGTCEAHCQ